MSSLTSFAALMGAERRSHLVAESRGAGVALGSGQQPAESLGSLRCAAPAQAPSEAPQTHCFLLKHTNDRGLLLHTQRITLETNSVLVFSTLGVSGVSRLCQCWECNAWK